LKLLVKRIWNLREKWKFSFIECATDVVGTSTLQNLQFFLGDFDLLTIFFIKSKICRMSGMHSYKCGGETNVTFKPEMREK
jgi:hypothetical protein